MQEEVINKIVGLLEQAHADGYAIGYYHAKKDLGRVPLGKPVDPWGGEYAKEQVMNIISESNSALCVKANDGATAKQEKEVKA